ncbi:glutamate-5-semialdehyde dehydrogenase [Candidatus Omnitrophota bacterium]
MRLNRRVVSLAKDAQAASRELLSLTEAEKNCILNDMAKAIIKGKAAILRANKRDIKAAAKRGLSSALVDRLTLNNKRIIGMADSLKQVARLKNPVGRRISSRRRPNGLLIRKICVPIGVIAIIYEARPNVTSDCAGLCLKSGNSVILRGGSEALNSNLAIYRLLKGVLRKYKLNQAAVSMLTTSDRSAVDTLLKLDKYIDLVIPRGGEGLIRKVAASSRIPVIKHYKGICHIFVDDWADLNLAQRVCFNAKVQRPGVCNAMETLLVHRDVAVRFLPGMIKQFIDAGVQIRGCALTRRIAKAFKIKKAKDKDYHTEYLDLVLSVKVVDGLKQAIDHINHYGSKHSDAIITENKKHAKIFTKRVDSACVYVNASTRFTDGYQFGMGAEIGISTDKIHARGPMALEELTSYKYVVSGKGQVRR